MNLHQMLTTTFRVRSSECAVAVVVCLAVGIGIGRTLERRYDPDAEARQAVQNVTIAALNAYAQMLTNQPPQKGQ